MRSLLSRKFPHKKEVSTYVVAKICKTHAAFLASCGRFISEIKIKNMKCPAKLKTGAVIDLLMIRVVKSCSGRRGIGDPRPRKVWRWTYTNAS
jgi:hypothetical protein